jgi:hypothetical protein
MVLNTTFNNISFIPWQSVLLVEETGVPGENHRPVASHWQTLSHNVVYYTLRFYFPYLSLLAQPVTIFIYGPVVYGPAKYLHYYFR